MQFKEFKIVGLFGLYNHEISFPQSQENSSEASVVMIYGANGIGKTTILKMIDGLMTLNFDIFRKIKFTECSLKFSDNSIITVVGKYENKELLSLIVTYKHSSVTLSPIKTGAVNESEQINQFIFVELYNKDLEKFSFEFIDTERLMKQNIRNEERKLEYRNVKQKIFSQRTNNENDYLANKVQDFLTKSQVFYEKYFLKSEPELFDKLIKNIENSDKQISNSSELISRLELIKKTDKKYQTTRLGIVKDKWDEKKLIEILKGITDDRSPLNSQKLTVINSYIEVLESRLIERKDLAERLLIFEDILNKFLIDKKFSISPEKGFKIISDNGDEITEHQLSTGEFHLLYLSVLALCTKVKGSIIAIDEPEMSMHISWQRQLVKALTQCASKANPQFIFATHSPDIASHYNNSLITSKHEQTKA